MNKQGYKIVCPHCKRESLCVEVPSMSVLSFRGDKLICSLCKCIITDTDKKHKINKTSDSDEKLKKFAAFLGEDKKDRPAILSRDKVSFCRDCKHYISHPFMNRCELHSKEVSPMDDCCNFTSSSYISEPKYIL